MIRAAELKRFAAPLPTSYLTTSLTTVTSMLPTTVTEVWTQARSYAMVQLPSAVANVAALVSNGSPLPSLLVVTEEGYLCRSGDSGQQRPCDLLLSRLFRTTHQQTGTGCQRRVANVCRRASSSSTSLGHS